MKGVCAVWILLASLGVQGQIDSLLIAFNKSESRIRKVDILNKICSAYRDRDNKLALKYGRKAIDMADSLHYNSGLALALENTGWVLYRMGDYTQSLSLSLEALVKNESLGDSLAMARCYNNIGAIGFEVENYKQAIQYFRKGLTISEDLQDSSTSKRSLINLSLAYFRLKKLDSAEYFANRVFALDKFETDRSAFAYRMLGDLAMVNEQYAVAIRHFEKSREIAQANGNTFLIASVLVRIGKIHLARKEFQQAERTFKISKELAESLGYKNELEQSYEGLSSTFSEIGNFKDALAYKSRYADLHDSLSKESYRERLTTLQNKHETELQEAQIKMLNQENLLNEQTIKNQRLQSYAYILSLAILMVSFIFLIRANRKIKSAHTELAVKKIEIENQAAQLTELNHNKDRIFQLLSHDLRAPVGSVKNIFELLTAGHITQDEFKALSIVLKSTLDNLYLDLNNLLEWSKSQLSGIRITPVQFELEPLIIELVGRAKELSHQKKVTITSEVEPEISIFADRDHLTSILRNLLSNALKFSNDNGRIWVKVQASHDQVRISVKDEGVGLTSEEIDKIRNQSFFTKLGTHREKGIGIGLIIINEFVKANNGSIEISSQHGSGSTFTVILPHSSNYS